MKQRLIIIGASAMGREACAYAKECGWDVKGFLDSRFHMLDSFSGYPPVLCSAEGYCIEEGDVFVCAVGDPEEKMKYVAIIEAKGGKFITIIHSTAYIGKNVVIGEGCIICPQASVTNDVVIGKHVIINNGTSINHDNAIGNGVTICPGCHLAGHVTVGAQTFLGIGTLIIPNIRLGPNMMVGAGAVVVSSFESGKIRGVPATKYE